MGMLDGRVAIVTGATRSMGAAIARRLAAEGARVAGLGRSPAEGEAIAASIRQAGGDAAFVPADIGSEESVAAAVHRTVTTFGRLDIIVNNAAATEILRVEGGVRAAEETTERFDRMMKVGVYGPFWLAKYGIPHIIASGDGGSIVNIGSMSAHRVEGAMLGYSTSKAAIEGFTRQLAHDYAADGIRVNNIVLGSIASDETAYLHNDPVNGSARARNRMIKKPGTPEDLANLVLFLASDQSAYMTAAMVPLDGGAMATYPAPRIASTPVPTD
ncbi:SDR family NAD(P)-dependent oxidoreductase [Dactylosporangium sucinum]|uniref:Cyclopentanol dehydrogenase n=1 Tax=Dactylosporangium sucinum TaxID=1424081 RepID=A0A917U7N1_9ACTN|nr:SDR family oxidoreductase [Dactylosporangium sucinum]GGM64537.1 cyclopentanol dehydrogenase [Dactylosporangium sucinum]